MTREEAIKTLRELWRETNDSWYQEVYDMAIEALSEEPPYQYSKAYVEQIRGERDILQDMVDNMAKPKTEMVLCALADRVCPFQGREFAWCLTCPHISEEDRALVKKAVAEPKTGWIPIKWHEITEEEREREGYPKDWVVHIDCDMPCDGDEILVQTKNGYIRWDVCYEDGEFSLDSGWDWIEDIVAWQNLPVPYKGGDDE